MKRVLCVLVLVLLTAGVLFAGGQRGRAAVPDNQLILVQPMMPTHFDPGRALEVPASRALALIYNTLVYQDGEGNIIPGLATSWEFLDAQTLLLNIRQGVRFHNGDILTADDVAFSLNRASASPFTAAITDFIREAVAVGPHQVRVTTHAPFAPMLAHFTHTATSIVNRRVVEALGDAHAMAPVGTGPFMFYNFVAGDRYELKRFDGFNAVKPGLPPGRLPAIEHIIVRIVPEGGVRTIELETGAAHIFVDVPTAEVPRIRAHRDLVMYDIPNFSINTWFGFNTRRAPMNDIRVRQAINYAIDIESIVNVAWGGMGSVARGPLPTTVGGARVFPVHPQNIPRARELMAQAGFPNGFHMDIWTNAGNPMRADAMTIIQAQLRAINIETTLRIYEWGVLLPGTGAGEHYSWLGGWVTSTGEADYGLYPLFHSINFGDMGNRFFYHNPRVDELLEFARSNTDWTVRERAYHEVQELIMRDMPLIPLWQASELHATRSNVGGFHVTGAGHLHLWNVYFR